MDEYMLQIHDPANETVNFGSQNVGNDLYEAVTLLSVPHADKQRNICSLGHKNRLYLSVDKALWIIDLEEPNCNFQQIYDASIDILQVINDILLVGTCDSKIHVCQLNAFETISVCDSIIDPSPWSSSYYIGFYPTTSSNSDAFSFLALTKKGMLSRIEINQEGGNSRTCVVDLRDSIEIAAYHNDRIIACGTKCISYDIYDDNMQMVQLAKDLRIIKIWPCNGTSFIALSSLGFVYKICTFTLHFYQLVAFENVHDFIHYYHPVKCFMFNTTSSGSESCVKLMQMKDKEVVYKINAENITQLIYNAEESANQMFISKTADLIRIHIIKEASLEGRLQRLIRKGQFIEAEQFACKYNLPKTEIDKAKILKHVDTSKCSDKDVQELIALMENIPDKLFNLRNCLNMSCDTIEGFERVLKYALSLDIHDFNDCDVERKIHSIAIEFEAYKVLTRAKKDVMQMSKWQKFNNLGGLHMHLKHALTTNNLEAAIILYSRLRSDFFNIGNIQMVLSLINTLSLNEYVSFLYTMIPKTMSYLQEALPVFIANVVEKVHELEQQARRGVEFPERAIDLIDSVLNIFEIATCGSVSLNCDDMEETCKLDTIRKCLETILELKNNYGKYLPLRDCLQGPGAILRVLLKANILELDKFLSNFLVPFMIRNGFDADLILAQEIKDLLKYNEVDWAPLMPKIWRSVTSLDVQLNLALDILQVASKPWCDDVRQILNAALELKHPLVQEIKVQAENEPKYIILCHPAYDLQHETLESVTSDMVVARRIIARDQPTLIDDVYTLYTNEKQRCEATYYMLMNFIGKDDFERAMYLLKSHTCDKLCGCPERVIRSLVCIMLHRNERATDKLMPFVKYVEERYEQLDVSNNKITFQNFALAMHILNILPKEFFNDIVFTKLQTYKGRQAVFKELISFLYDVYQSQECGLDQMNVEELVNGIRKYADVFDVTPERILLHLSEESNNFEVMLRCATYINENSTDLKTMCWITTLILRSVGRGEIDGCTFLSESVLNVDENSPQVDEQVYIDGLKLARKIIVKACLESKGDRQVVCVADWALATSQMVEQSSYDSKSFPLNGDGKHTTALNMVRQLFTTYTNHICEC